jgi:hypothetical protein
MIQNESNHRFEPRSDQTKDYKIGICYFSAKHAVLRNTHWTYMHIFRHIFLSNYWWQKSDIWSQASYRYPISWEAFFDPSDSYFLFSKERGYHRWELAHSSSCWYTYMMLVTKYQISAINSYWEKCDEIYLGRTEGRTEGRKEGRTDGQTDTIDGRNLIFGHKLHIGTPYPGKRFLTRQIPTSCLPKSGGIIWGIHMKLVTKYQISVINSCWEKCDEKYLGRTEGRTEGQTVLYTLNIYAHFSSHFSQQLLMAEIWYLVTSII